MNGLSVLTRRKRKRSFVSAMCSYDEEKLMDPCVEIMRKQTRKEDHFQTRPQISPDPRSAGLPSLQNHER